MLARFGRYTEALDWAESARRDYEKCEHADNELIETLKLLKQIESDSKEIDCRRKPALLQTYRLKTNDRRARDFLEVADISSKHGVVLLDC